MIARKLALAGGLALTFPTVARLVGERFFDQMAIAFARAIPITRLAADEPPTSTDDFRI